jgi:hypothetical protein
LDGKCLFFLIIKISFHFNIVSELGLSHPLDQGSQTDISRARPATNHTVRKYLKINVGLNTCYGLYAARKTMVFSKLGP